MKRTLLLFLLIVPAIATRAQQTSTPKRGDPNADIIIPAPIGNSTPLPLDDDPNKIYTEVEQTPTFPGGMAKFYNYLQNNLQYPASAKANNIRGKVFLSFVVEKDGAFTDIKVLRGISPDCDAEAIRLMKVCPKWRPGVRSGKPVRVAYSIPVTFSLPDND